MGMGELIVVLIVVVLVFGANKIPALGDGLGKAIRNFKKSVNEDPAIDVTPARPAAPAAPASPAAPPAPPKQP
jgi:sec-independent protein translocase protein TatA